MSLIKTVFLIAVLALTASNAAAEPARAKRPSVCTAGEPVKTPSFSGFLCTDGAKPRLFARFTVVTFADADGKPARYILGWSK